MSRDNQLQNIQGRNPSNFELEMPAFVLKTDGK